MTKTHISNTTLFSVCWGAPYFRLTLKAIIASLKNVTFDEVVIVADCEEYEITKYNYILNTLPIKVVRRNIPIKENIDNDDSRQTFSQSLLTLLSEFCSKNFILTIQPDSCIISSKHWRDDFFNYDYVGAPWPMDIVKAIDMAFDKIPEPKNFVGNGGFSLRSKKYVQTSLKMPVMHKNEDLNLCVFNYDNMVSSGIKFAPISKALDFAVEHPIIKHRLYDRRFLLTYNSFGFHGEFNIAGMKYIHQNSKEIE